MLESGDLRKGLKFELDGEPYVILQFEFVKPGKGQALYKCKLKNMVTGVQFDKTFRSGEKFNEADLEEVEMEYLYADGESYCFMNTTTYEQDFVTEDQVSDTKDFLKENTVCCRFSLICASKKQIPGSRVTPHPVIQSRQPWKPAIFCRSPRLSRRAN
jgi:elongation factor P